MRIDSGNRDTSDRWFNTVDETCFHGDGFPLHKHAERMRPISGNWNEIDDESAGGLRDSRVCSRLGPERSHAIAELVPKFRGKSIARGDFGGKGDHDVAL
jgi:hypothetical protein